MGSTVSRADRHRRSRRARRASVAALVCAGLVWTAAASGAQSADPTDDECLTTLNSGAGGTEQATRRLILDDRIDAVPVQRRGEPTRRRLTFTTSLEPEFLRQPDQANFQVSGTLFSSATGDLAGYVQVSATADSTDRIVAQICIDASPADAERLAVGAYRARLEFDDVRIPETAVDLVVHVGDTGSPTAYWSMVLTVAAAIALATWFVTSVLAPGEQPWVRSEALHHTTRARVLLAVGVFVTVVVIGIAFEQNERYDTWSPSMRGVWTFLVFSYGALLAALAAAISGLARVRELTKALAGMRPPPPAVPAPTTWPGWAPGAPQWGPPDPAQRRAEPGLAPPTGEPTTSPATAAPPPLPPAPARPPTAAPGAASPPSSPAAAPAAAPPPVAAPGRRDRQVRRRLALVGGLASVLLIAVVAATATLNGDRSSDDGPPATTGTTPSSDTTVVDPPDTEPFADLVVGETSGADAVAGLRAAGFVVFDYSVCSSSVPDAGLLRLVRVTESGAELVGSGGVADAAGGLDPDTELDVLVTNGEPCG